MYCSQCKKRLNGTDKFCPECGAKVIPSKPQDRVYTMTFKEDDEKNELSLKKVRQWLNNNSIEIVDAYAKIFLKTYLGAVSVEVKKISFKYKKKKVNYQYGIYTCTHYNGFLTSALDKCNKDEKQYLRQGSYEFYKRVDREAYIPGGRKYRGRILIFKKYK